MVLRAVAETGSDVAVTVVVGDSVYDMQMATHAGAMAIGAAIILFLIFEPDGLAHRWKQIKAYWKLYPFSF